MALHQYGFTYSIKKASNASEEELRSMVSYLRASSVEVSANGVVEPIDMADEELAKLISEGSDEHTIRVEPKVEDSRPLRGLDFDLDAKDVKLVAVDFLARGVEIRDGLGDQIAATQALLTKILSSQPGFEEHTMHIEPEEISNLESYIRSRDGHLEGVDPYFINHDVANHEMTRFQVAELLLKMEAAYNGGGTRRNRKPINRGGLTDVRNMLEIAANPSLTEFRKVEGLPFSVRLGGGASAALEIFIDPSGDDNGAMWLRHTSSIDGEAQFTANYTPYYEVQMPKDKSPDSDTQVKIPPETIAKLVTHGHEWGFSGGTDDELAELLAKEILDYNLTAWARGVPMIEWIDISACDQRNKRAGYNTTHGQDFKRMVKMAIKRLLDDRNLHDAFGKGRWRVRFLEDADLIQPNYAMSAASEGLTYGGLDGTSGDDPRKIEAKRNSSYASNDTSTLVNLREVGEVIQEGEVFPR
jgi:hypothetical protein